MVLLDGPAMQLLALWSDAGNLQDLSGSPALAGSRSTGLGFIGSTVASIGLQRHDAAHGSKSMWLAAPAANHHTNGLS